MEERFKSAICVDLLLTKTVDEHLEILLMKRKNTGFNDGEFELPGGHLEKNEDLFDAMIRESKEELLIDVKKNDLKLVQIMHHYSGERINFIFELQCNDYNPLIGETDKCDELQWFRLNEIPNNISEKMKTIINNYIENRLYDKM